MPTLDINGQPEAAAAEAPAPWTERISVLLIENNPGDARGQNGWAKTDKVAAEVTRRRPRGVRSVRLLTSSGYQATLLIWV